MKYLIIFSFLFSFSTSFSQNRVINGVNAEENAYQWMGTLEFGSDRGCGATLIHPEWVLTAAHCTWFSGIDLNVVLNPYIQSDPKSYAETLPVDLISYYPGAENADFLDSTLRDVVLLKLAIPSTFDPIAIAKPDDDAWYHIDGFQGHVLGWGIDQDFFQYDTLQYGTPIIFGKETCDSMNIENLNELPPKEWEICSGYFPGELPEGAAAGDSGGPLFVYDDTGMPLQVGVVSRGDGGPFTTETGPGIFTKIGDLYDWVMETIEGGSVSSKDYHLKNNVKIEKYNHKYTLILHDLDPTEGTISIFDFAGRLLNQNSYEKSLEFEIPTTDIAQGIYVIHLQTRHGIFSLKFNK